jgi:hypothetical protein
LEKINITEIKKLSSPLQIPNIKFNSIKTVVLSAEYQSFNSFLKKIRLASKFSQCLHRKIPHCCHLRETRLVSASRGLMKYVIFE